MGGGHTQDFTVFSLNKTSIDRSVSLSVKFLFFWHPTCFQLRWQSSKIPGLFLRGNAATICSKVDSDSFGKCKITPCCILLMLECHTTWSCNIGFNIVYVQRKTWDADVHMLHLFIYIQIQHLHTITIQT